MSRTFKMGIHSTHIHSVYSAMLDVQCHDEKFHFQKPHNCTLLVYKKFSTIKKTTKTNCIQTERTSRHRETKTETSTFLFSIRQICFRFQAKRRYPATKYNKRTLPTLVVKLVGKVFRDCPKLMHEIIFNVDYNVIYVRCFFSLHCLLGLCQNWPFVCRLILKARFPDSIWPKAQTENNRHRRRRRHRCRL